ncbi:MAG: hypothetical protein GY856_15555 [bacterium]|nr:hypothetical protein [bacterium]
MKRLGKSIFIVMLLLAAAGALPSETGAGELVLDQVLDSWAEALGGREQLAAAPAMYLRHTCRIAGLDGVIQEWYTADGRHRAEIDLGGVFHIVQVYDGRALWVRDQNGKVSEAGGADLVDELTTVYAGTWSHLLPGRREGELSLEGREEDTGYVKVRALPAGGESITWFLDPKSRLPVRWEQPDQERIQRNTIEGWKQFEGILLPAAVHQTTGDPRYDSSFRLEEMRLERALQAELFQQPREKADDTVIANGKAARDIPIELNTVHIFLQAKINGQGPYWLLLDTGASVTVLDTAAARKLGLELHGSIEGRGSGEGSREIQLIPGVSFAVPGAEIRNQTVAAVELGDIAALIGRPLDGILGYDFISRFVVEIDYAALKLHLYERTSYQYQGEGSVVPIHLDGNQPHVTAIITAQGREPIDGVYLIDTGSGGGVSFARPFTRKHDLLPTLTRSYTYTGGFGIGGASTSTVGRIARLEMGGLAFEGPVGSFGQDQGGSDADPDTAGILGGRILSRCTVIFDYDRQQMILEPNARFGQPFKGDMSGILLKTHGPEDWRAFEIVTVVEGSPGERAGLEVGDLIESVDGRPRREFTGHTLWEFFREKPRSVQIEITRDGERMTKTLELAPMI